MKSILKNSKSSHYETDNEVLSSLSRPKMIESLRSGNLKSKIQEAKSQYNRSKSKNVSKNKCSISRKYVL